MTYSPSVNPFGTLSRAFLREKSRWALWTPLPVAAGIVLYFALPTEPPLWAALSPALPLTAAWLLRRASWPASILLFIAALMTLGFAAGIIGTSIEANTLLNRDYGPTSIQGRVAMTEVMPDGVRLTLTHPRIDRMPPAAKPEKIRIKFTDLAFTDAPKAGADISFFGQVMAPSEPVAPGAFDFRRQAYFKHIGGSGWSFAKLRTLDPDPPVITRGEAIDLAFERARKTLARHVMATLQGDVAAMTTARLNGEQTAISRDVTNAMRIAGLTHLLAASGSNVTIMGLLIYFPLRALLALIPFIALRYPIKKWAAVTAIISATFYTLLVGTPAAAMRALLMSFLIMLAVLFDRRATPMRLVMMSSLLCMLLTPDTLMGPSFQLSFAAVFCLVALNRFDTREGSGDDAPFWLAGGKAVVRHLGEVLRSSLIATAATTPFCLYHFQSFSLYGFISNMVALPLTSFWVMPMILIAYVLAPFQLDGFFIRMAGLGDALTIRIAQTVSAWPYSIFYWPAMPSACLIAITLGGLWLCLWREKWKYIGLLPILVGMAYPLYTHPPDFFITADGKQWAAKLSDGRLAVSDLDKNPFTAKQWQQRLGNPVAVDVSDLPPDNKDIRCDAVGCVFHHGTHRLALPATDAPQAALEDCAQADIVVANVSIKDCAAPTIIDEADLWFRGAHSVTFDGDKVVIDHARATRGARPWSMGYRKPFAKEEY